MHHVTDSKIKYNNMKKHKENTETVKNKLINSTMKVRKKTKKLLIENFRLETKSYINKY